jgi:hypothetical protein
MPAVYIFLAVAAATRPSQEQDPIDTTLKKVQRSPLIAGRIGHLRIARRSIDKARTSERLGGIAVVETHGIRRGFGTILAILCIAAATLVPAPAASAAQDYGSLTARWWQWVYSQPAVDIGGTNTNPLLDPTGEYATAGQENGIGPGDKFFFLTGTFGGDATRTVTVPYGKALFFPIFNYEADNALDPPTDDGVPELKAIAKAKIDAATELDATFDGDPVKIFRSTSPTFDYTVPDENSIYDYFGLVGPQFEGRIKPAVADGYWAYIPPPSPGKHVLKFHSADNTGFSLNVTYNLTVGQAD